MQRTNQNFCLIPICHLTVIPLFRCLHFSTSPAAILLACLRGALSLPSLSRSKASKRRGWWPAIDARQGKAAWRARKARNHGGGDRGILIPSTTQWGRLLSKRTNLVFLNEINAIWFPYRSSGKTRGTCVWPCCSPPLVGDRLTGIARNALKWRRK